MIKYLFYFLIFLFPFSLSAQENFGYLKFNLNVDSAYVVTNNDFFVTQKIANGDSILLETGTNLINVSVPFDEPINTYKAIFNNATVILSHNFESGEISPETMNDNVAARYYHDANIMVLTDDDSKVFFDGKSAGTGFAKTDSDKRKISVLIRNPDFGSQKFNVQVQQGGINFVEAYRRPKKSNARIFSVIPGASQVYKRQYIKGIGFSTSTAVLFFFAGRKFQQYSEELDLFKRYKYRYNQALDEAEALEWGYRTEKQQDIVTKIDNQRKFFLISGLMVYGLNIYDAFSSTPTGGYYNKKHGLKFYLSRDKIGESYSTVGTIQYNF